MKKELKISVTAFLTILTIAYFMCYSVIVLTNRVSDRSINILGINVSALSGVIVTIQMLIGVSMALIDHRKGGTLAQSLMIFSIVSMTLFFIRSHDTLVLPGIGMLLVCLNTITILKRQLRMREAEAITDYLTGLHNRRSILRELEQKAKAGKPFFVMYIDLDNFKFINDSFGHKSGDMVLKTVADRINPMLDKKSVFGRIGGDEFVIIIPDRNNIDEFAAQILRRISDEICIDEKNTSCYMTASIGIIKYPDDSTEADKLIKYSDIAMYYAKKNGRNRTQYFNSSLEEKMLREAEIETMIKDFLAKKLFYLVYQPQFETSTKKLRGFETLLRIKDEENYSVQTSELITVAEKSDLIFQIDDYVLEHALNQFRDTVISSDSEFTLSVNVSARNISRKHFTQKIEDLLEQTNFPASSLEIEITEYCLVNSLETAVTNIKKLKDLGVKIALDDFGTGYASLSYLSKLPIDLLKIDKSFVDDITDNNVSSDFINAVISMGHLLNCEVISEGVETDSQLSMLETKKCDYIQGFIWSRPLEFEEAVKLCGKTDM